jgi:hypothetical protein
MNKEADLVFFNSKDHLGLLCFYSGHRSLDGRPQNPSLGGRLWPQFPWELRTVCLPMISLANGAGSQRWLPLGSLPPKVACLLTLETCPWVWTLSWRNLSAVIRASCHLFFFFSLSRSFFSFSMSLLLHTGCGYLDQLV